MRRAFFIVLVFFTGCAARPREQLQPVAWKSEAEALQILARRAEQVQTVSAQGLMTMRKPDGESVRLDLAMVSDTNGRLRLRAWKLGRAVFDLTMSPDGVWMLLPDDPSIRKRVRDGQLNLQRLADSWELFNGRFFRRSDLVMRDEGRMLVCSATIDDSNVRCEIDARTLTPRRYVLRDPAGAERFSLVLSEYREIGVIPFARRYVARSEMGEVLIALDDIELNGELAEGAFVPPRRAEKLK